VKDKFPKIGNRKEKELFLAVVVKIFKKTGKNALMRGRGGKIRLSG